jgi:hypothetical protein
MILYLLFGNRWVVFAARVQGQSNGFGKPGRSNRDSIQNFDSGIERRIIFQTEFASNWTNFF